MAGRFIEENLFTKYSIIDPRLPEGQKIHAFLEARAHALASRYINFDETPVTFVISDSDEPNAFYAPGYDPKEKPNRDQYDPVRYVRNPLDTAVICISRGLLEMVDNLDQLDFVLGHELTHMIMRLHKIRHNSKGEEEMADLHSVDLIYDAGGDPKQSLAISEKISAYMREQRDIAQKKRYRKEEKTEGINWSEIFDVHMTDSNRRAGLEASLTRLSHLIDDRQPTPIDKDALSGSYTDPVDDFLNARNYKDLGPADKIKALIDCIDHICEPAPAAQFFQDTLDDMVKEYAVTRDWGLKDKIEKVQKQIEAGCKDYYSGPVITKKYQQKIANLAEDIFKKAEDSREQKGNPSEPIVIPAHHLNDYLQDRAYAHIAAHGYPIASNYNYLSAAGVMYSYFYNLLEGHSPRRHWEQDDNNLFRKEPQLEADILRLEDRIKTLKTAEGFIQTVDHLDHLHHIQHEISTETYGDNNYGQKLDNLTAYDGHISRRYKDGSRIYGKLKGGDTIPWNNLVAIAQSSDDAKARVVKFLGGENIEDFRITHNLPYVRLGYDQCYKVNDGTLGAEPIPEYELSFAVNRDLVLQAYDYLKSYFASEAAMIDRQCAEVLAIDDSDFRALEPLKDSFSRNTRAHKKLYDFISLFNALPDNNESDRYRDRPRANSLIPQHHQDQHPIPGSRKSDSGYGDRVVFEFSRELLSFDNPIFQKHFGADYEQDLVARKEQQQQQMFDTAFAHFKKATAIWKKNKPKLDRLQQEETALNHQIWDTEDREIQEALRIKKKSLEKKLAFYKKKDDETSNIIYNFLYSIFDDDERHWYHLQRMTVAQKKAVAEYIARDEKDIFEKVLHTDGYEFACDYLKILEEQTKRIMEGHYELTDMMRVIARNYGYEHQTDKESLKAFAHANAGHRYSRNERYYQWNMHMFDVMRHLEVSPSIDIHALTIAYFGIQRDDRSSRGNDPGAIVAARYDNHRKFVIQSNLTGLMARAIDHQDNYKDLTVNELFATIDGLIATQGEMAKVFSGKSDDGYSSGRNRKSQTTRAQTDFLELIDKNVENLLKQAEALALNKSNALEKITDLFCLYNPRGHHSYDGTPRSSRLKALDKAEGRLKHIAELSQDAAFWPEDVHDHIKAFVLAKNTFLDDKDSEDKILNNILDKLGALPVGRKKDRCLHILLDKNLRASYPETRDRLFTLYTEDAFRKLGKDDGSARYQKKLAVLLKKLGSSKEKDWDIGKQHGFRENLLSNTISAADKYLLMRQLSDAILSQEKTSQMIKESCQIKLNSDDMVRSYLYGIGVDYLTEEMNRDPEMAKKFIQFFNSKGEKKDCEEISAYIETTARERYKGHPERLFELLRHTQASNCKIFYENFWSAPLEARAVTISRVLDYAVKKEGDDHNMSERPWEEAFDLVMNTLVPPGDQSIEARYARDVMHSYIKSRSSYERVLIMSAMMVANRNIGNDAGNIGKALKLFLENMGPAEIKLGQAIASHPHTPEKIKSELQNLKSAANIPPRWTLYDWIKAENIPEQFWKDKYLGETRGSASYYTTVDLGDDEVLRILRPEAREKAGKGFKVIRSAVIDLKEKEGTSDLSYQELTSSVQEMIVQADRMSEIETDHDAGEQQYRYAKDIYDGVTLECGNTSFPLKVMDWHARGQNWIIMEKAKGHTFNALPETTPEERAYKRQFAKAYIVFELRNILSGKKFDHDKHGAQLSIDPANNRAGIYDTGAMALHDPTVEDQKLLGNVIHDVMKEAMQGREVFTSFSRIIAEKIEQRHAAGESTQYLVEVKKGLLALGDFFKILTPEDIKTIMPSIHFETDVSNHVYEGITEGMSMFERAQLQMLLKMQAVTWKQDIIISRMAPAQPASTNVIKIDVAPGTIIKSSWLRDAFSASDNDDSPSDGSEFMSVRPNQVFVEYKIIQ